MNARQLLGRLSLILSTIPAAASAQRAIDAPVGARLRLELTDGGAASGRLLGADSGSVRMRRDDQVHGLDTIPLARVRQYRLARQPSPTTGAWIGALSGAVVGVLIIAEGRRQDLRDVAPILPRVVLYAPLAVGAVFGGARLGAWVAGRRFGEPRILKQP